MNGPGRETRTRTGIVSGKRAAPVGGIIEAAAGFDGIGNLTGHVRGAGDGVLPRFGFGPRGFSWSDVEKLPEHRRLERVLDVLPDEELPASLEAVRGRCRDDSPVRAMWRAVAAGVVVGHRSTGSLVRECGLRSGLRFGPEPMELLAVRAPVGG